MKYLILFEEFEDHRKTFHKMSREEFEEYKKKHELTDEQMDGLEELNKKYGLGFDSEFTKMDVKVRCM
ncbi:hypothetical protein F0919_05005 [Taibaiella lutea]|uniref:Uncharacterized protein n=1 Tax=Taibaiella lutea TaxID=2608001 RepID=A0A5M6CPG1_9BACT|nr:hypothetical protein F0919_05005 [Taibaiella lutea]